MDFSKIAGSSRASKFSNIVNAFGRTSAAKKTTFDKDDTSWYPERDKEGNAKSVIRFLPGLVSEGEPCFIEKYSHGYKNVSGQWYIENCPSTIGRDCPVCLANKQLVEEAGGWDVAPKAVKDEVGKRKRKQQFTCNILVISDKANPDNNGKVFRFNFGKKILEKIMGKIQPEFDDVEPVNIFDYKEGANFRLSICKVDGYVNYDKSEFDSITPMDDATIARVKDEQHTIMSLIAEDQFKEYKALETQFLKIEKMVKAAVRDDNSIPNIEKALDKMAEKVPVEPEMPEASTTEEDDYFAKLAAEVA